MLTRKDAALAVCVLLASAVVAKADTTTPALTLEPTVVALDAAAPRGLLMGGLDKVGAGKTLDSLGLNIYGWVESGYTANLRSNSDSASHPGPFTTQPGNHYDLNEVDLTVERTVDLKKFDVGGRVDFVYGTDAAVFQSNGMEIQTNGSKHLSNDDNPGAVPILDIPEMYIDIAIPVGNGLKVRVGKFWTPLCYETTVPTTTPFYTHSYIFRELPFTQTGVMAYYNINDQWAVSGGITRGWDQFTEDTNDAIDFLGSVSYTPNKQLTATVNLSVGPQNADDNAHYRTVIDPILSYKVNDKLSITGEAIYIYDGGINDDTYGDAYGVAGYVAYAINDMFTLNGRAEWNHNYEFGTSVNLYEFTAGVTIKPMPKDPILSNLSIRPEIRYDVSEDRLYTSNGSNNLRDNWTAAADVIFTF